MGERLYYRDATLREFDARVVAVGTINGKPTVTLDRTAFYPTSGGQPNDTGLLGGVPVVDVRDVDHGVVHVLDGAAPAVGSEVHGTIDWTRRFDHTQQHTGQHVLSQAFEVAGGLRTVSFHLGVEYCTIDLNAPQLTPEIVSAAEELANRIVIEDRPIIVHFAQFDDLERFGLRKPTERSGEVRIVEVEDFDRSACGGTHVARTGQIGPIKVRRWERRGAESRVEFVCGWRALRDYAAKHQTVRALADRLSVKDSDLAEAVGRALEDLQRLRDDSANMREDLLRFEAADLIDRSVAISLNGQTTRLVARTFVDRGPDELKRLALFVAERGAVALLASRGTSGGIGRSHLVFAQTPGLPLDMAALLRASAGVIDGRGGGTKDVAQGGGPADAPVERALAAALAAIDTIQRNGG